MPKAGMLLVAVMVLLLLGSCAKKPPPAEKPTPPVVTEPEPPPPPPEIPEEVTEEELTQGDLQAIHFDFDKYDLRPGDREILNRNADMLRKYPAARIRIEGNCDERGTVEYNLALGEKRARAAKDYLVNLGINPDRISIITYGKERADRCHNDECWHKDRRDDFMITSK